jgi:AbrB family looped-hinge helix DNA binding protein
LVECKAMAEVTISSKNQIVIPREAREALGVKAGDKLLVTVPDGKVVVIERPAAYHKKLEGLVPPGFYGPDYLKEERASWKRKY